MRDAFVRSLLRAMKENDRLVLVTGDLGFGVLRPVREQFPRQLFNAGIAEQSMVSMASGLAATGRTVVVYSIGNFPTLRPLEQIRNDCAYHQADVKIVCVGGGFVYGSLGMSHHATEDMAVMRAIPGVTCLTPGDPAETEAVTDVMLRTPGTFYLRLGRGNEPQVHREPVTGWTLPRALVLRDGKDIALLSAGGILTQTVGAAKLLEDRGVEAEVVSFPSLKPLDEAFLRGMFRRHRRVITVEEHTILGGFGGAVCEILAEEQTDCRVRRLGLRDCFTSVVGDQQYLRQTYGLDEKSIAEAAEAWLKDERSDVE